MNLRLIISSLLACFSLVFISCSSIHVDVTKTGKGFVSQTNPNDVEILMTRPDRPYEELGTVTVTNVDPNDTAKMHNAIRSKAAALGADAVILTNEGINPGGMFSSPYRWAIGVAIRYKTKQESQ